MKKRFLSITFLFLSLFGQAQNTLPSWALGGFVRPEKANPIITPNPDSRFDCPMREKAVGWEENGLDRYYLTFATGFHVLGYSYNWVEDAQDGGFSLTPTSCYYQRGTIETTPALYTVTANETQIIVPVYYQGRNYNVRVYGYYD